MKYLIRKDLNYWLLLLLFIIIGGVFLFIEGKENSFLIINSIGDPSLDSFFKYITYLGDGRITASLLLLLLLVSYKRFIQGIMCLAIPSLITLIFKRTIFDHVSRPSLHFRDTGIDFHTVENVSMLMQNSFPSGHTTAAFALFTFLALIVKNTWVNWILFTLALLSGISRIYLGQHFFTDVYFGAMIGSFFSLLVFHFTRLYFMRKDLAWADKSLIIR